ncbi:hypothetical protein BH24ACT10_BH24ACT10_03860 [soil metagenome]
MTAPAGRSYDQPLRAPVSWWLAGLALSVLLAAAVHAGGSGARAVVPYVLVPALVLGGLGLASQGRVRVTDGVLHVPRARIPLTHVGGITPLDRDGTRQVRGPLAEPRAYVVTRPWLSGAVRVQVEDPEDDTPYWLVGARDPGALAQALSGARSAG